MWRGTGALALVLGLPRAIGGAHVVRCRRCRGSAVAALTRRQAAKRMAPEPATAQIARDLEKKSQDEAVQAALEAATPVPQSFDQATAWACAAVLNAAEAGRMKQTIFFNSGTSEADISGDLGLVLSFVEQFGKMLTQAKPLEGGNVRVLFNDLGSSALATQRWTQDGELPENLKPDYFPPMTRAVEAQVSDNSYKFEEILDAEILIVVVPTEAELPAILRLLDTMGNQAKDIPIIFVNARLQSSGSQAGILMSQARRLIGQLCPTFHLEQIEPESEQLNAGVVARVWPRPYSTWEDNPNDPDATDGYFLLDLNDNSAPSTDEIVALLEASRDVRKMMEEKQRALRAPRVREQ